MDKEKCRHRAEVGMGIVSSSLDPNYFGSTGSRISKALRYLTFVCFSSFSSPTSAKSVSDFSNMGSKNSEVLFFLSIPLYNAPNISKYLLLK